MTYVGRGEEPPPSCVEYDDDDDDDGNGKVIRHPRQREHVSAKTSQLSLW
jgi:hypothetical protein